MLPMIKNNSFFPSVLDEFFNEVPAFRSSAPRWTPKVNVAENDKSYQIELAVPGMEKEDFKIEVKDDVLVISSEKKEEKTEEGKNYSRREFSQCSFSRSFILPDVADSSKIEAAYKNGILDVTIPKKEAEEKLARVINIQ